MFVHLEDLELLKKQHEEWNKLLKEEESHPSPDIRLIQQYKKHKFQVKEEIRKLENKLFSIDS